MFTAACGTQVQVMFYLTFLFAFKAGHCSLNQNVIKQEIQCIHLGDYSTCGAVVSICGGGKDYVGLSQNVLVFVHCNEGTCHPVQQGSSLSCDRLSKSVVHSFTED